MLEHKKYDMPKLPEISKLNEINQQQLKTFKEDRKLELAKSGSLPLSIQYFKPETYRKKTQKINVDNSIHEIIKNERVKINP